MCFWNAVLLWNHWMMMKYSMMKNTECSFIIVVMFCVAFCAFVRCLFWKMLKYIYYVFRSPVLIILLSLKQYDTLFYTVNRPTVQLYLPLLAEILIFSWGGGVLLIATRGWQRAKYEFLIAYWGNQIFRLWSVKLRVYILKCRFWLILYLFYLTAC